MTLLAVVLFARFIIVLVVFLGLDGHGVGHGVASGVEAGTSVGAKA